MRLATRAPFSDLASSEQQEVRRNKNAQHFGRGNNNVYKSSADNVPAEHRRKGDDLEQRRNPALQPPSDHAGSRHGGAAEAEKRHSAFNWDWGSRRSAGLVSRGRWR